MYTKKFTIAGIFCSLMATLFFTFRTVPQATLDLRNTSKAYGTIEKVLESGNNNVVIKLKNDNRMYYLELDRENKALLADLKQDFMGQPVEIYYEKQWSSPPQRPGFHHIERVNLTRNVFFTTAW
jgi:hypothetical protein